MVRKRCGERASTLVEMAIALPVVIFLLFAIVQWGLIISASITMRSASAVAARMVAIANPAPTDAQLIAAARAAVAPVLLPASITATVTTAGSVKTINLSYPFPLLLPFVVPGSSGGTLVLNSSSTGQ